MPGRLLLLLICFAPVSFLTAQITGYDTDLNQRLENIAEKQEDENPDFTDLLQNLTYYKRNPVNLNYANEKELSRLNILNPLQINTLLRHIEKNGKLLTVYELQSIDNFDPETIEKLLPFIIVSDERVLPDRKIKNIFSKGEHVFFLRMQQALEKPKGYAENSLKTPYAGSRQKIYSRYRFNYANNISAGVTAEKDPGEEFFRGSQKKGFDFYSGHFYISDLKKIKALAVGDYQLGYGQGLTAWSGLAFDKSADALNLKKNETGIRPYLSADENRFMRGVATTLSIKNIEASGFCSFKKTDASASDTSGNTVSSLQNSGYHRTEPEIKNKDALGELTFGGNIAYNRKRFSIGITSLNTRFDKKYRPTPSYYNQFYFSSDHLSNTGINYSLNFLNFNFFGESALSSNGGLAFLNGVMAALDERLSLALLHRNYQKNYQSLYSNGFSENTTTMNEKGIYLGITTRIADRLNLNFYYDRFVFPWLKYRVTGPSGGNDILAQLNYTPSKKTELYLRFRKHDNRKNEGAVMDYPVPYSQINYRYHIKHTLSPSLILTNRIEMLYLDKPEKKERGFMMYQDVRYKSCKKLTLSARYILFSTDSYDSRVYASEGDVVNAFSFPSYYYKGSRFYLIVSYDISKYAELGIRYGQTVFENQDIISEGTLDEITGNKKSELKIQLTIH